MYFLLCCYSFSLSFCFFSIIINMRKQGFTMTHRRGSLISFIPAASFVQTTGYRDKSNRASFFFPQTSKEAERLWVLPSRDAFKGNHFPCGKPSVYSFCNCYTNAGFFQAEHNPLGEKREASRLGSPPETRLYNYSCLDSLKMFEN